MLAALDAREALLSTDEHGKRVEWRKTFEKRMVSGLPRSEVVGAGQERLWNTVSALMPEADSQQRWIVKLDKLGFAVSTGSACSSGKEEPSHVIAAMGYPPRGAGRVLRFSSGWETTEDHWDALLEGLQKVHRWLKGYRQAGSLSYSPSPRGSKSAAYKSSKSFASTERRWKLAVHCFASSAAM